MLANGPSTAVESAYTYVRVATANLPQESLVHFLKYAMLNTLVNLLRK
jgi:hypothetical protein